MIKLYILVGVMFLIAVAIHIFSRSKSKSEAKAKYNYQRKQFFLTKAENELYKFLVEAVGNEYYIFAQAYLPSIVDHKVVGQNWAAALSHIQKKSVDFVLCDKQYISPKLVIEYDDKSHERDDRKERDVEVERILDAAGLSLLRIPNTGKIDSQELLLLIRNSLTAIETKIHQL